MIKKIAWLALHAYVFGFLTFGIFSLGVLNNVSLTGFLDEFKTREMPWHEKTPVKSAPNSTRSIEPESQIAFEIMESVG